MTGILDKLEKVIEDLYYGQKLISFTETNLPDGKTKYEFITEKKEVQKSTSKELNVKKEKVVLKKEETKQSGPIKPPKPLMAEITSIGRI